MSRPLSDFATLSFNKLHKELGPKGLMVRGVSMDEDGLARVQPFLKKHPMDYTATPLGSRYPALCAPR